MISFQASGLRVKTVQKIQKFVFVFQCVLVCSHHSQQLLCLEDVFLHLVSIVLHLGDQQGQAAGLVPAGCEEKSQTEPEAQTRSLLTESQLSLSPSLSTIPNMLCNYKIYLHYQNSEREWKKRKFFVCLSITLLSFTCMMPVYLDQTQPVSSHTSSLAFRYI